MAFRDRRLSPAEWARRDAGFLELRLYDDGGEAPYHAPRRGSTISRRFV